MKNKSNELLHKLHEDVTGTLTSLGLSLPDSVKPEKLLKIIDDYVKDYSLPEVLGPELRIFLVSLLQKLFGVAYLRIDQAMRYYSKGHSFFQTLPDGEIPLYSSGKDVLRHVDTTEVLHGDILRVSKFGSAGIPYFQQGPVAIQDCIVFLPEFNDVDCKFAFLFMNYQKKHYSKYITGTTVPGINPSHVLKAKLPIIELPKQLEIVKRVYSVLEAKEAAEKSLADLTQIKAQSLKKAMQQIKDMRQNRLAQNLDSLVKDLNKTCQELGFELPELSTSQRASLLTSLQEYVAGDDLSQFDQLKCTKSLSFDNEMRVGVVKLLKTKPELYNEQLKTFKVFCNLVQHFDGVVELPLCLIGQRFKCQGVPQQETIPGEIAYWMNGSKPTFISSNYTHEGEAVFISRLGFFAGRATYWNGPKLAFDNISLEPREGISSGQYLYFATKYLEPLIRKYVAATATPALNPTTALNLKVLVPSLEKQLEIADYLGKFDECEAYLERVIKECDTLFNTKVNETFSPLVSFKAN